MYLSFPETIIVSPRSESLFYVRVGNPEIKIGYTSKLKIAHGIYLGDTIVENVSGKAYLNVISTLDEEVEVPTLRLTLLNKLFDNYESNVEAQDDQREVADMQFNSIHQENNQIHCEISNINSRDDKEEKINNNEDVTNEKFTNKENQILNETKKEIKNKVKNKVKGKIKNKIMKGNNDLKKKFRSRYLSKRRFSNLFKDFRF